MSNLDGPEVVGAIGPEEIAPLGGKKPMAPQETGPAGRADAALVRRLRSDDADALRHLMEAHWAPLVGFAHRILAGTGDPEDTVQNAFVRLWSRRRELELTGSLRALLYTIVRNSCLDELRKRTRRERAQQGALPPPTPRTPYEDVQGAELHRLAAAAVARLPERRREVFRLVREEGLSYQEIAEIMGLSTQTVANHMSLAMADLRATLKPHFPQRTISTNGAEGAASKLEQRDG